jgi:DNA repair ATPase RecN
LNVVLQVAAGLGGLTFIGGIITALALWKKNGADAASVLTDRALKAATTAITNIEQQAEKLGHQLEKTQGQLELTREELRAVRRHMGVLERLLRDQGVAVPELVWPPRGIA